MTLEEKIVAALKAANAAYRSGRPLVTDEKYDQLLEKLRSINPDSEFLKTVEPEGSALAMVQLPVKMLSTDKAYSHQEIQQWVDRVLVAARRLGIGEKDVLFRITPKLDGYAACYCNNKLYTRGNGVKGQDITHSLARNLYPEKYRKTEKPTLGEIVVDKNYFNVHLSGSYENTRNVIAAVIKKGKLDRLIAEALDREKIMFVPFKDANLWIRSSDDLIKDIETIWKENEICTVDTDGLVIEVDDSGEGSKIKEEMGATGHHYRWQIAYKKNADFFSIKVLSVTPQTSKSGRITPVVELEPTKISGAVVSRATGHHYGNIISRKIDTGAIVRVCRSGLVIPYISDVIQPAESVNVPDKCPSCGTETEMDGDNLLCPNLVTCPAQIEGKIEFFFKAVSCKGFGEKIVEKLAAHYSDITIKDIFTGKYDPLGMNKYFGRAGISAGVGNNLIEELRRVKLEPIEDWRLLSAFGIKNVGKRGCEQVLRRFTLEEVLGGKVAYEQILQIDGFGEKTATTFIDAIEEISDEAKAIRLMFSNIVSTKFLEKSDSKIFGKTFVFTGSMLSGKREDHESRAKQLGAKVGSSVSKNTDYLVCGQNVGAAKTTAAKNLGIKIISEKDYLEMIKQ